MASRAKMIGPRQLQRKLHGLPDALKDKVRPVLKKNADELVAANKRDVGRISGALADTIVSYEVQPYDGLFYRVREGARRTIEDGITISAADQDAGFYALFHEFGTSEAAANPHFFSNYRTLKPRLRRRLNKAVRDGVKASARRG